MSEATATTKKAKKSIDDGEAKVSKTPTKGASAKDKAEVVAEAEQIIHGVTLSHGKIKNGESKQGIPCVIARSKIQVQKGFNSRKNLGEVDTLAASVKKDGLINPVTIRPNRDKEGYFYVVAGHRRFEASGLAGLEDINVTLRTDLKDDDERAKAVNIAENSEDGRFNLNPIEMGRACQELEKAGWTVQRIASECCIHPRQVRRVLDLVSGPEDIIKQVESGKTSMIAALELVKLDESTRKAIKDQLTPDSSAAQIKSLAKAAAKAEGAGSTDGKPANKKTGAKRDAALVTWKSGKEKHKMIIEVASRLNNASKEDEGTSDWFEMRGLLAGLFWDRGDLDMPFLPANTTEVAKEKKLLKAFDEMIANEAAKAAPPAASETEAEETK